METKFPYSNNKIRKPIYKRFDLIPAIGLDWVARVMAYGALRYGDEESWREYPLHGDETPLNRAINHLNEIRTGKPTALRAVWLLAKAATNCLMAIELIVGTEEDNDHFSEGWLKETWKPNWEKFHNLQPTPEQEEPIEIERPFAEAFAKAGIKSALIMAQEQKEHHKFEEFLKAEARLKDLTEPKSQQPKPTPEQKDILDALLKKAHLENRRGKQNVYGTEE